MSIKNRLLPFLGKSFPYIFYSLLAIFLFLYLRSIDYNQFENAEFVWYYLAISGVLALSARFLQTFIWLVILKSLGAKDLSKHKAQLLFVYAKAWLGRYIPGTAPWILGKIYFASKHGISKHKLAVSSLLEGALQIAVVMSVSFIMLFSYSELDVIDPKLKILMGIVLSGCVIAILPPVFNRTISIVLKKLKKKKLQREDYIKKGTILRGASLYTVGALLSGLSLFFIAKAIYPSLSYEYAFFIMGAGNLAGAASMLAVFAPSGIGVREGIQLVLLSIILPVEIALLVTVTTRLWGIVMDFLFFAIAKLVLFTSHRFS